MAFEFFPLALDDVPVHLSASPLQTFDSGSTDRAAVAIYPAWRPKKPVGGSVK
jgi:hypothetical protein